MKAEGRFHLLFFIVLVRYKDASGKPKDARA